MRQRPLRRPPRLARPASGSPARRGLPQVGVSRTSGSPFPPASGSPPGRGLPHIVPPWEEDRASLPLPRLVFRCPSSQAPPPSRPATSEVDNATTTPGRRGKRLLAPSASRYMVARQWALMSVSLTTRQTSAALRPARLAHPLAGVHASAFYADHTVRRRGTETCSRSWTEDGTMWLDRNRGQQSIA